MNGPNIMMAKMVVELVNLLVNFQLGQLLVFLLAKLLRENPSYLAYICFDEDTEAIACTI